MEKIKKHYSLHFNDRKFMVSFFSSFLLLIVSLIIQYFTSGYVTRSVGGAVTDIVLSNTRVYDVDIIFVYGALLLTLFIAIIGLYNLKYAPFIIKSVAIFTLIRSAFVSLTHISVFPDHILINSVFFRNQLFSGIFNYNDLFFSGHTGVPFLLALMFWDNKKLRYIFLGFSIIFGISVLLGHLHYSIDVLSAFFISYGIFDICKFLFKKDWELFNKK